jgi:hypothetical protein
MSRFYINIIISGEPEKATSILSCVPQSLPSHGEKEGTENDINGERANIQRKQPIFSEEENIIDTSSKKRKTSFEPENMTSATKVLLTNIKNYSRPEKNTIEYLIFLTIFGHQGSSFIQAEAEKYNLDMNCEKYTSKLMQYRKCKRIFEQLETQEFLRKHFTMEQYEKHGAAGYFNVITKPMDFNHIEYNMKSIRYANWDELEKDLRLLFENARVWNKHTQGKYKEEMDAATELERLLDKILKERTEAKAKTRSARAKKSKVGTEEEDTDQGNRCVVVQTNRVD